MADNATTNNLDADNVASGPEVGNSTEAVPITAAAGSQPVFTTTTADNPASTDVSVIGGGGGTNGEGEGDFEQGGKEENDVSSNKDGKKEKPKTVGLIKLFFKYATKLEVLYMLLGTCFAIVAGWVYTRLIYCWYNFCVDRGDG